MRVLDGREKEDAQRWLERAAEVARDSTCEDAKCGAVIVKDEEVIGEGYNSPPGDLESQRRCENEKDGYDDKVTDRTCCVHAKERAVIDALKKNEGKVGGSRLYFMRVDEEGGMVRSGEPYCTICSKLVLDVGVDEFVLWREKGIVVYGTEEYNDLSYGYEG